jgi:Ca2+/Na+ antiporter
MLLLAASMLEKFENSPGAVLIALAGLACYIASRAAADALAGGDPDRPGHRALGHCIPIAAVAFMCLRPGLAPPDHPDGQVGAAPIAVGVVFAASVACLTLVLGVVTYLAPVGQLPNSRRVWSFVLPTSLLALVAGFDGQLTWIHAAMLMLLGLAILNVWHGAEPRVVSDYAPEGEAPPGRQPRAPRWIQLGLSIALALVGGWAMARGAATLDQSSRVLTGIVLAGTVIGPLLTLPVLGNTAHLAERGHVGSAITTLVVIVLINLCGVLPLVILGHHALSGLLPAAATAAATVDPQGFAQRIQPAPYPLISWRVDTVILVVLGFGMIPWAIGRWTISRAESIALIFAYAIYLALIAILATRTH